MHGLPQKLSFSAVLIAVAFATSLGPLEEKKNINASEVERGKYLVVEVAKCTECHTPRNADGQLDTGRYLQGAPIWITPVHSDPNWAQHAPALAGFPSFSDEEGERVLEKGIGPEGEVIRPPMHIYHMKPEDAKAIISYLKSLPRPPG